MNESSPNPNSAEEHARAFRAKITAIFDYKGDSPKDELDPSKDELKLYSRAVWTKPVSEMTPEETLFSDMYYFWQASILNSGDVAGRFAWLGARRVGLETIGANGCLKAMQALRPHYEKAVAEGREEGWEWGDDDEDFRQMIVSLEEPAFEDDWEKLLL
ncbi:MAG: hypothetical protein JWL81_3219, partial [Verrucomicrobiales bacterium]|nr:hypothetical protein [Verrucomicrobiales bacterium]